MNLKLTTSTNLMLLSLASVFAACSVAPPPSKPASTAEKEESGSVQNSGSETANSTNSAPSLAGSLGYAGMYGTVVGGVAVLNPATGAKSCPAGYTPTLFVGTSGLDWDATYCFKKLAQGEKSLMQFGGMYGFIEGKAVVNPITNANSCPGGFNSRQVLGTNQLDYPLFVCDRPNDGAVQDVMTFGGIGGVVLGGTKVLLPNGSSDCETQSGFTRANVYGTTGLDHGAFFCFKR